MTRLPTPGSDAGQWGEILNDFLSQAHTADGKLKTDSVTAGQLATGSVVGPALANGSVTAAKIADGTITSTKLDTSTQATLAKAETAVQPGDLATVATAAQGAKADSASQPGHTHSADAISDSTAAGRALLTGADAAAQRTSLGLGTAATTDATDYATAAQGVKADASDVHQITLTGNLVLTIPAGHPAGQIYRCAITQTTGGHTVTYGGQPVSVDPAPGAATVVELHPVGAGYVVRYPVTDLDAQVSALAEDGGSALGASLSSTYAARLAARNEYLDDFSQYSDGYLPTDAPTGETYVNHFATPAARIRVADGFATFDPTAIAGGYASVELSKDVVRIGGVVKFGPYSVDGGLAAWAITQEEIGSTVTAGRGLPAMAAHLQFSPKTISVQVGPTAGGALVNVFGYTFPTPLVADDAMEYLVELTLDKANGCAYLLIPGEGRIVKMTHAAFSIPARWTYFEPYRNSAGGATGKTLAKFRQVWADSRDLSVVGAAAVAAAPRSPVAVVSAMPTGDQTMTLTNTPTAVPGAEITFTFPPSGRVLLRFSAFVDVTVDGVVYLGYKDANDVTIAIDSVAHKVSHSGKVSTTFVRTGTPGASFTAKMIAFRDVLPTAATLILGQLTTPTRYGKATVEVLDAR